MKLSHHWVNTPYLGKNDKYFTVHCNHTIVSENSTHFPGKEDTELRHRKNSKRRKETLDVVLLKQSYFMHYFLKLS